LFFFSRKKKKEPSIIPVTQVPIPIPSLDKIEKKKGDKKEVERKITPGEIESEL